MTVVHAGHDSYKNGFQKSPVRVQSDISCAFYKLSRLQKNTTVKKSDAFSFSRILAPVV